MRLFALLMFALAINAYALTNDEATNLVQNTLAHTRVASSKSYCTRGTMTCRTMYRLVDVATGQPSPVFYDTFYSADRQVGSTCYFVPTKEDPNQYYVLTDAVFDGKLAIDRISPFLAQVVFSDGQQTLAFENLKSPVIGTTRYVLSRMVQTEDLTFLEGTEYDSADPSYKKNIHIDYFRVNP